MENRSSERHQTYNLFGNQMEDKGEGQEAMEKICIPSHRRTRLKLIICIRVFATRFNQFCQKNAVLTAF